MERKRGDTFLATPACDRDRPRGRAFDGPTAQRPSILLLILSRLRASLQPSPLQH